MGHKYDKLTYLDQQDFPSAKYGKAALLRAPIRDAINSARHSPAYKMDEVRAILQAALSHIDSTPRELVPLVDKKPTKADPLDELMGAVDE